MSKPKEGLLEETQSVMEPEDGFDLDLDEDDLDDMIIPEPSKSYYPEPYEMAIYTMYMLPFVSAQEKDEKLGIIKAAATEASSLIEYQERKGRKKAKAMTMDDKFIVNGIAWFLADVCKELICDDRDLQLEAFNLFVTKVENFFLRNEIQKRVRKWGNNCYVNESTDDEVDMVYSYLYDRLSSNITKFDRRKAAITTFCGFHIRDACNKVISDLHENDKATNNNIKHIKRAVDRLCEKGIKVNEINVIREVRTHQLNDPSITKPLSDGEISRLYNFYVIKHSMLRIEDEITSKDEDSESEVFAVESGTGLHNSSEDLLSPEVADAKKQTTIDIIEALESLEPIERKLVCMCMGDGFAYSGSTFIDTGNAISISQAASSLGIKEKEAHIYLTKAKTKLAQILRQKSYGGTEADRRRMMDDALCHSIVPMDDTQEDDVVCSIARTIIEITEI